MVHALLDTPHGFILATSDDRGVLVLARPLPSELRDDLEGLRRFVHEGGIYIVAFAEMPGTLHALRVPLGWSGEHITSDHVIRREVAIAACGEGLVDVCVHIAAAFAEKAFASWRDEKDNRDAALRAVLTSLPVGEA
jgi:hypothetical protein